MVPKADPDAWVFDTVKAPTLAARNNTSKRRKLSVIHALSSATDIHSDPEEAMSKLDLKDSPLDFSSPQPLTVKKGTVRRQASIVQPVTPTKPRQVSAQKQPLQPDMSFGNTGSTVRLFRRVSDNSTAPLAAADGQNTAPTRDENRPPLAETVTKEALLGRRLNSKVMDNAFQEMHAQTGNQAKREALSRLADAWSALDAVDPEGEYQFLKLVIEKVQQDAKLTSYILPSKGTTKDGTPQGTPQRSPTKLVMAQNNPHLKSHRRRQSSFMPEAEPFKEKLHNLPGQAIPGMEHTKQLTDVIYGRWSDGLRSRWPAV